MLLSCDGIWRHRTGCLELQNANNNTSSPGYLDCRSKRFGIPNVFVVQNRNMFIYAACSKYITAILINEHVLNAPRVQPHND